MRPEELFLAAFWICLRNDISGRGCVYDSLLPRSKRRLPYQERVILERVKLQSDAEQFLDTSDFTLWADQSGLDSIYLREQLRAT